MPLPFANIPQPITLSWGAGTREVLRYGNKEAMAEMRFLERFLAFTVLKISGSIKPRQDEIESMCKTVFNEEMALPIEKRRYMKLAEKILNQAQAHISDKHLGTLAAHQGELLMKWVMGFQDPRDAATISTITDNGCIDLFHALLTTMVRECPAIGVPLPPHVLQREEACRVVTTPAPVAAAADDGVDLDELAAFLNQTPLITPQRTAALSAATTLPTVNPNPGVTTDANAPAIRGGARLDGA